MTLLGPRGNGTVWSKTSVTFIPYLTKHVDLDVKYTKSCLGCLYCAAPLKVYVCATMGLRSWDLLIETKRVTLGFISAVQSWCNKEAHL